MRTSKSKTLISMMLIIISAHFTNPIFAQSAVDTAKWEFHDDLLNHLVGKWNITGVVHSMQVNLILNAEWVLNHQFLRIYEKSEQNVPGINVPWEEFNFIGYDNTSKRYVAHSMTVCGGDCTLEAMYGNRTGNEIKLVFKENGGGVQRFTWQPESGTWHLESRLMNAEKEGEPFADLKAIQAKPSSN